MGYLEDEVKRLQTVLDSVEGRLKRLEERQFGSVSSTADAVRMILIGPPGAGMRFLPSSAVLSSNAVPELTRVQARGHKRPRSRKSSPAATW